MIQNTCKLRTNNFSCDCCDEHNCQRYIAYQQGREDAIDELVKAIQYPYDCGFNNKLYKIAEQLKEQNNE